ncbi:MAG: tetratricopeptide repeat protein [bacterium]
MKSQEKIICLLILPLLVFLTSACGQTEAEKALETAKTLTRSDDFSDTKVIQNLQTSERLLERLVKVQVEAAEWRIFALRKLINRYIEREMWPLAAREVEKLIQLQPTNAQWYLQKGQIYSQWAKVDTARAEEAKEAFEVALQLNKDYIAARYGLGVLHSFRLGNVQTGRDYLEKVAFESGETVKNRDTITNARFALARLEHREGNYSAAIDALAKVPDMDGISRQSKFYALKNIARIYEDSGSAGLAREYYLRANELVDDAPEIKRALERLGEN